MLAVIGFCCCRVIAKIMLMLYVMFIIVIVYMAKLIVFFDLKIKIIINKNMMYNYKPPLRKFDEILRFGMKWLK